MYNTQNIGCGYINAGKTLMIKQKRLMLYLIGVSFFALSCSSLLKYKKNNDEFKIEEFEKKVRIIELDELGKKIDEGADKVADKVGTEVPPESQLTTSNEALPALSPSTEAKIVKKSFPAKKIKKSKKEKQIPLEPLKPLMRQPEIEDSEGFANLRRPLADPFRVGEKVTHAVSYLGASAGTLTLHVKPFAIVNERKNYNFFIDIKSSSLFSKIFAVDDQVQTYVDYENLVPGAFLLEIRDSGQVKSARSFFDFENLKANYWEHRYTEKHGHEEKKLNWTILPYSQNPFSAIFYMRVFTWKVGKECVFRVADDEKNVIFKARAVEKTKLSTEVGEFNAIKLKAEIFSRGNLSKAKDFYLWISDDDRKYVLRIEVKLPIGSLVSEVTEISSGHH